MKLTKLTLLFFALLSILELQSCCPADEHANYLNLINPTEPKNLDPAISSDYYSGALMGLMYNNLVEFDSGVGIVPGLAESWAVSEDGRTYTFQLRDSVRFWNGDLFTSSDVKHSFERLLDPSTLSPQTWLLDPIKGARAYTRGEADSVVGIKIISDHQLQLELESPFAPFIGFLGAPATAIVNHRWKEDLKLHPMGTGPWIFVHWLPDQEIQLDRNTNYFRGPPKLEGVILNSLNEILTMAIEFEAGNLDIMSVPASEFKYWTRSSAWKPYIYHWEELSLYYLAMNVERPPFDDKRVRQALDLAIDKEKIIKHILHNSAVPALGAIPPGLVGHDSSRQVERYNPEKARQLLKAAGYEEGCEFELWVDPAAAVSQTIEAIQHYLIEAGFKVHLVRNDWNMMRDAMRRGKTDAYWGNWWADYADAENFLAPLFHSSTAAKRNRYNNPEVDHLIEKLQTSLDAAERVRLAKQIDGILVEEVPYSFLWYTTAYTVVQPNLKGYVPHLMPNANRYTEIYFE